MGVSYLSHSLFVRLIAIRLLDPRLPGLVCGVMVGIGLLVVNFLRVYGKCWVPVRLETAPTGIVE